jgi:hypothetical protein
MATFPSSAGLVLAVFCLACTPQGGSDPPPANTTAAIVRQGIDHITPKRDFVGAAPARLEWTAAAGVDGYSITVMNEVDALILDSKGITTTSMTWPKEVKLEPGTYFWRVAGIKDGRAIADSGRSAFVVNE